MSTWSISYLQPAQQDLRDIYEYIAFSIKEPENARSQMRRIIQAIEKLKQMHKRHRQYEKEPWCSRGLRVLPVDNYVVHYLPMKDRGTVMIISVMYGGRDVDERLRQVDIE